jgi:hypothetical protein
VTESASSGWPAFVRHVRHVELEWMRVASTEYVYTDTSSSSEMEEQSMEGGANNKIRKSQATIPQAHSNNTSSVPQTT